MMLWLGTAPAAPAHARTPIGGAPDATLGYGCVEEVPPDAAVRKRFSSPHVAYVGSHEGCGCGLAEQRSRAWLRAMVERARADGPVELFACWAGDEVDPAQHERVIDPVDLTTSTAPLTERTHYVLREPPMG